MMAKLVEKTFPVEYIYGDISQVGADVYIFDKRFCENIKCRIKREIYMDNTYILE